MSRPSHSSTKTTTTTPTNTLPIFIERNRILKAVSENQAVIIVGTTGSGKTTQIPQFLHAAGYSKKGRIAITQPRRVAAISIAKRVSQEMNTLLGQLVGYTIRFEDQTSKKTRIKYLTDGMLLRELLSDPLLSSYTCIILDEAHERTLRTDILFGMIKSIMKRRAELKVIVMSATLNAKKFSSYFDDAPVIEVKGRQFPVVLMHSEITQDDYLDAALVAVFQIHQNEPKGDILVFLTGQEEIENAEKIINENNADLPAECMKLIPCPIYASMPTSMQTRVFEASPEGTRKVILSTNIAETSITINGVKYVIDTGLSKVRSFNPSIGLETLSITPISKASANQRMGRAGRECPGTCYRLYTQLSFDSLLEESEPEIKRVNLSSVLLLLKASGVDDIVNFDYMDKPTRQSMIKALEELYALEALDDSGSLTPIGRRMAELPLDPNYAKLIINAKKYKCESRIIDIISMMSIDSPFYASQDEKDKQTMVLKEFKHFEGDHLTLLNVLIAFLKTPTQEFCDTHFIKKRSMAIVLQTRTQLRGLVKCGLEDEGSNDDVLKCILSGFFQNVGMLQGDGGYKIMGSPQPVYIHPSSHLFKQNAKCVVFGELVKTSRVYMKRVSVVRMEWVMEVAPHYYKKSTTIKINKN